VPSVIAGVESAVDDLDLITKTTDAQEVGFSLGNHMSGVPVVIEQGITWNTFLGGDSVDSGRNSGTDYGRGIAVDGSGNVYVTGTSYATWGSPVRDYMMSDSIFHGGDAFVAKLDSSGTLTWNTFLGGSYSEEGRGIAVDGSGNVYVTGTSEATWGSPVRDYTPNESAFVAKLDGNDGTLIWNTFLGRSGWGIAVDGSGNVYVTGTSTTTWGLPVRDYTPVVGDAFVARLDGGNGTLTWNTFLGSSSYDYSYGIAVDGSGNVYVTGLSWVTWGSPVRAHSSYMLFPDAFIAKLDGSGNLTWNTFLGGRGSSDYGQGIAVDDSGDVYVTGESTATWGSPARDYYTSGDAFAAKLDGSGNLTWNTFLGGDSIDEGNGIAADGNGYVYITGRSDTTWGLPVRDFTPGSDAFSDMDGFVAKLDSSGNLTWNTFLGGSYSDSGQGIAIDGSGNVYVSGGSGSTWGSPTQAYSGGYSDAFTAKLDDIAPMATITYMPAGPYKAGDSVTITATFNETMADSPVVQIAISGANTLSATDMMKIDSTQYIYIHTIGSGEGIATLAFSTGIDLAGNPITSEPSSGSTFTVVVSQESSLWIWFVAGGGVILVVIASILIRRRMAQRKTYM